MPANYSVKLGPALVDVTKWVEQDTFKPEDSDLGQQIATVTVVLEDDPVIGAVPVAPTEGLELRILSGATVKFGGWVRNLKRERLPTGRVRYHLPCQDYNARLIETTTNSLNYAGTDNDRNMVIGILRDALKQVTYDLNGALVDDPIITANEPDWPMVRATAVLSGMDFSYMSPGRALTNLKRYVPNVYLRIRPDRLVQYGLLRDPAPYALAVAPAHDNTYFAEVLSLEEETILTGHFNKLRRGGAGASTATAYDEVAIRRYGLMESPYKNDTTVPAADVRRRAYAELRNYRPKVARRTSTLQSGFEAGQLVDLIDPAQGAGTRPAPYLASLASQIYGRSPKGKLSGERGRFLIQKVTQVAVGATDYRYDLELGDNVADFPTAIAKIAPVG